MNILTAKMLTLVVFTLSFLLVESHFIHPLKEETYEIIVKLCKNEFFIPVSERSHVEKAAIVKFWRAKGRFKCEDNILYYDGKKVIISRRE